MNSPASNRFHRSTCHQTMEPCRNCGTEYVGNYCPNCGQEAHTGAPTALAFIYEFLTRNVFERGKLPRTIWHLIRYPGGLTVDFLEGRRQRFIRPVRLYIGLSVLYFLILSLISSDLTERMHVNGEPANALAPSAHVRGDVAQSVSAASAPDHDPIRFSSRMPMLTKGSAATESASGASAGNAAASGSGNSAAASAASNEDDDVGEVSLSKDFDLEVDFLDKMPDTGAAGLLKKRVKRFTSLPKGERGPVLLQGVMNQAPKAMFFLVPVFAMLLKLLFVFRRVPYGVHLLFAFHYHSLLFLGLLLMFLPLPEPMMALLPVSMWLYLGLALRTTYMCGWFGAMMRLMMLSVLYSIAISLALMGAVVAAVLL